jgi:hypothetical protein
MTTILVALSLFLSVPKVSTSPVYVKNVGVFYGKYPVIYSALYTVPHQSSFEIFKDYNNDFIFLGLHWTSQGFQWELGERPYRSIAKRDYKQYWLDKYCLNLGGWRFKTIDLPAIWPCQFAFHALRASVNARQYQLDALHNRGY